DHPLPHRLRLERLFEGNVGLAPSPLERAARHFLLLAGHLHVAAERKPGDGVLRPLACEGEPPDRRAESEREPVYVHPRGLGGEEVPELVHEDEHPEHDDERTDRCHIAPAAARCACSRAHWSAWRTDAM